MRKLMAYIQLPITWLALYGIGILLITSLLILAEDSFSALKFFAAEWIITTAVMAGLASYVATAAALKLMLVISPDDAIKNGYWIIVGFALFWIGGDVIITYIDHAPNLSHKIVSLITAQIGVFVAYVLISKHSKNTPII